MYHADDPHSISFNDVSKVLAHNGKIYAGTWGGGLNVIDPLSGHIERIRKDSMIDYLTIKSMVVGPDSMIWIATYGDGILKFNPRTKKIFSMNSSDDHGKSSFSYNEAIHMFDGQVWIGSRVSGLGVVSQNSEIETVKINKIGSDELTHISCVSDDGNDLLIGTQDGTLFVIEPETRLIRRKITLEADQSIKTRVSSMIVGLDGQIWVASSSGLFLVNKHSGEVKRAISPDPNIDYNSEFCLFKDSRDLIWLGSWGSGLNKYSSNLFQFKELNLSGYKTSTIKKMHELNDSTLLLGSSQGVLLYDKKRNKTTIPKLKGNADNLHQNIILGFASYQGNILVGVDAAGLFSIDSQLNVKELSAINQAYLANTYINNIQTTADGNVWVTTWSSGLIWMNPPSGKPIHYKHDERKQHTLNSDLTHCVYSDQEGQVWIGNKLGLSRFDPKTQRFKTVQLPVPLRGQLKYVKDVRSIAQDARGKFWLATSEGLILWDREVGEATFFKESENKLSDQVVSLYSLGDYLWCGTKSSLVRMNVHDYSVENYTTKDGLLSNSFVENSMNLSSDSILYLGSGHGMVSCDYRNIQKVYSDCRIYFKNLMINGAPYVDLLKDVNLGQLKLSANQNNLSFEVTIQDFGQAKKVSFYHQLIGFEQEWIPHFNLQDEINYHNLPPGDYELLLALPNQNNSHGEIKQRLKFSIQKPFWQNAWFLILALVLFMGVLYLLFRWLLKALRGKNAVLEERVLIRTQELSLNNQKLQNAYQKLEDKEQLLKDNINYAAKLKSSLQPGANQLKDRFSDGFVLHQPQAEIGGDFYWQHSEGTQTLVVAADCTGHGVSAAFLSVVGMLSLRTAVRVKGIWSPGLLLDELHQEMSDVLAPDGRALKDGLEISVICFDSKTNQLKMASAMSSIVLIDSQGREQSHRGNHFPVGGDHNAYPHRTTFKETTQQITDRTMVYLSSDGFQEQLGGVDGMKYTEREFRDLLIRGFKNPAPQQRQALQATFEEWKGAHPQTDDVLVVGLEFSPSFT